MARRASTTALRLLLLAALLALATAGLFGGSKSSASTKSAKATTVEHLQIGIKSRPAECTQLAKDGDRVWVHYKGTLLATGEKFDASYDRNQPFDFTLGTGNVIKGWDLGVAGMCPGEVRKLKIPAALGYGASGSPPKIPGGASLVFQVELLSIGNPPK